MSHSEQRAQDEHQPPTASPGEQAPGSGAPGARGASVGGLWWLRDHPAADLIIPCLVFVLVAGLSVWLWRLERAREQHDITEAAELVLPVAADRFDNLLKLEVRPLTRFVRELGSGTMTTPAHFVQSVSAVQEVVDSLKTVAWVDRNGRVQAVAPGDATDVRPRQSVRALYGWGDAFNEAYGRPRRNWVMSGRWQGRTTHWVCMPYRGAERVGQRSEGAVIARMDLHARAAEAFGVGPWLKFDVLVRDETDATIYASAFDGGADLRDYTQPVTLRVFNRDWTVRVRATDALVMHRHSSGATLVLIAGLAVALLLAGGVAQGMLHRRRDRRRAEANSAALEALSKLSVAISDRPGESTDVLVELGQVASRLMVMPMFSITLFDPRDRSMHVVHRHELPNPDGRDVYDLSELSCSAECMRTARPLLFGDVEAAGTTFKRWQMRRFGVRSLILLPLVVSGNATGVLLLASGTPRRFSRRDVRLAELWMAEASAILSNRKLYEQMNAALTSVQRILHQRETLHEVNARIQYTGSLADALRLVAELAPRALDVDACVVGLTTPQPGHIHIASVTPGQASDALRPDTVVECATCASVLARGEVRQFDDLRAHPIRGFDHMGSALFVPLTSGGATIGLLTLLRARGGAFDAERVRVAELFGARTASAIENARLYEQTRRQADHNAILLRELNHRVGNNFAGIIGLLRVAARELPAHSRHGLDRAVERVRMMARAHELFSGGVASVRLADLVQTAIASMPVIGGRDVTVRIELEDPDVRLYSTRAITLAMVLHELAFNAVEHGLAGGGDLIVRARRCASAADADAGADADEAQGILIEVIDRPRARVAALGVGRDLATDWVDAAGFGDGNGNGNGNGQDNGIDTGSENGSENASVEGSPSDGAQHRGIGLQLVRNLVARELRGHFTLTRSDSGTSATIEFQLEQESEWHP